MISSNLSTLYKSYVVLCRIVVLGFINRLNYRIMTFRKLDFFVIRYKGGKGQKAYPLAPLVELASDLQNPTFETS
jgi:hypothetical protein